MRLTAGPKVPRESRRFRMRMRLHGGTRGCPTVVVDTGRHRAEVALPGEHLAEGVGHVNHRNVGGVNSGRRECISHYFGRQIRVVTALAGEVAREVALITAEDPDVGSTHGGTVLQLRE